MWCLTIVLMVESGGSDDGTAELREKLFSYSNSTFDYSSDEDNVFEATRFKREKSEEERIAKRKLQQQNEQPPTNKTSNKPRDEPTGSFDGNDKRKTVLGETNNSNNNNNNYNTNDGNNNNNNNYDYTNSDNASVDNDEISLSEGDTVRRSRRTRTQPDRLTYDTMGGVAALPEHLTNTCLYLFDKAKCMGKFSRKQCEDLIHEFIEWPKTILAAYYAKFQKLSYDLDSGTIEDRMPISLLIRASEKDDLTWAEARVAGEFELF